jgi:glycerol uptake facilitator protein
MHLHPVVAEFIGTCILIVLGDGVVANVVLAKTKGQGGGGGGAWTVITLGWGMAVFVAEVCVAAFSGPHLNPAVTIGLATAGKFAWESVPAFAGAQVLGALVGAILVYFFYRRHFELTSDANLKLAVFCTAPNVRDLGTAFFCEVLGTFMLVFPIFLMVEPSFQFGLANEPARDVKLGMGALGALPVGLLVLAIGLSLGGTTGYAINPARDLGPRIAHAILPIPGKRDSDWGYAWIPVVAPIVGGMLAALAARGIMVSQIAH